MAGKSRLLDLLTVVTALAAIAVAGKILFVDAASTPARAVATNLEIPNWQELAAEGRRIGPSDALMTITEWVDYQCPACKAFHRHVAAVLRKYPDEVALVIRHLPLTIHASAYPAARAAECAAAYGDFATYHSLLLEGETLDHGTFMQYGEQAGVTDQAAFAACIEETDPVDRIERDIAAAEEVGARGTPTVIVDDIMLASWVDSLTLEGTLKAFRRNRTGS